MRSAMRSGADCSKRHTLRGWKAPVRCGPRLVSCSENRRAQLEPAVAAALFSGAALVAAGFLAGALGAALFVAAAGLAIGLIVALAGELVDALCFDRLAVDAFSLGAI